jgi:hypothetical protein
MLKMEFAASRLPIGEVLDRIIEHEEKFWPHARGWAPASASDLLERARLDRQVSLARCLHLWAEPGEAPFAAGRLILAWANLGSLVEGSMALCLSAWAEPYGKSKHSPKGETGARDPDRLSFEQLIDFFRKEIWNAEEMQRWGSWLGNIKRFRNAIHVLRERDIGTHDEWLHACRQYLVLPR